MVKYVVAENNKFMELKRSGMSFTMSDGGPLVVIEDGDISNKGVRK